MIWKVKELEGYCLKRLSGRSLKELISDRLLQVEKDLFQNRTLLFVKLSNSIRDGLLEKQPAFWESCRRMGT